MDPTGSPWTFSAISGVAGNGSAVTNGNPNAPQGTQVAWTYGSVISQSVSFAAGSYTISLDAAQRGNTGGSGTLTVEIDGQSVGTFTPTGASYTAFTTNSFTVAAGNHTIALVGSGVNTVLIDQVTIQSTGQNTHNVVFVATEHDSLYAIDANNGTVLWKDSLLNAVHGGTVTSVPSGDVGSGDLSPEIGITATPVIDASTNTLYVEAKTKEVASDGTHYIHQLYAINLVDGTYELGGPIVIADSIGDTYVSGPTVKGTGSGSSGGTVFFDSLRQLDRPALTEANGNIYLAYASHGDNGPYHGWVLSYNAATLQLNGVFNTTPNGSDGGIWQSGGKLAVDAQGNLYFETGNGTFDTTLNSAGMPNNGDYGDSFVKIAVDPTTSPTNQNVNGWGLTAVDYFTPFDQQNLNNGDLDLGSGGLMLLPPSVGSTAHPQLLVGSGKEGRIYLIDANNMGHFDPNTDHVVQETNNTTISGSFDTPAYFNNTIYYVGGSNIGNPSDVGKTFSISNGQMSLTPTSQGPDHFGYPGATPSISANGTSNGVVWTLDHGSNQLRAYNATGFNTELYTSAQAPNNRDALTGSVVKFSVPTVANGEVFVGTSNSLNVYGLLGQTAQTPSNLADTSGGVNFTQGGTANAGSNSSTVGGLPTSTILPETPSMLSATVVSGTQINLTWANSGTNQTGFLIDRATDSAFTQNLVTQSADASAVSFVDSALTPGTTYYYRLRIVNAAGDSTISNTVSASTPQLPDAVSNLQVTAVGTQEVDLSWTNNAANAAGIDVFRKLGGNSPMLIASLPATATSLQDTGLVVALQSGTSYIYNVQAINAAGPSPVASVTATTL
jgi:hypothetical protein